jgi:hypothetical protein
VVKGVYLAYLGCVLQSFIGRNRGALLTLRRLDVILFGDEVAKRIAGAVANRGIYATIAIVVTQDGATNMASITHDKGNVRKEGETITLRLLLLIYQANYDTEQINDKTTKVATIANHKTE